MSKKCWISCQTANVGYSHKYHATNKLIPSAEACANTTTNTSLYALSTITCPKRGKEHNFEIQKFLQPTFWLFLCRTFRPAKLPLVAQKAKFPGTCVATISQRQAQPNTMATALDKLKEFTVVVRCADPIIHLCFIFITLFVFEWSLLSFSASLSLVHLLLDHHYSCCKSNTKLHYNGSFIATVFWSYFYTFSLYFFRLCHLLTKHT